MRHKHPLAALIVVNATAFAASWAQLDAYPVEASMRFEAWNGSAWSRDVTVLPGARVEWRVVMNYTGPHTDLFAIGEVQYQPITSNADNTGLSIADRDRHGVFYMPGGNPCDFPPCPGTTPPDGNDPNPQNGYGRVRFGFTANNTASNNVLTTFRHSDGSNNAPPGEWMRIAGSFVSQWPTYPLLFAPGADAINRIQRGVASQQVSLALTNPPGSHTPGVHEIPIFRMATLLSDTNLDARTLTITSDIAFLKRAGGPTSTDDRRYMTFQTSNTDTGSYRVGVAFQDLTIHVVPGPGGIGVLWAGAVMFGQRPRRRVIPTA